MKIITAISLLLVIIVPAIPAGIAYSEGAEPGLIIRMALITFIPTLLVIGLCVWWCYGMMPLTMSINAPSSRGAGDANKNIGEIVVRQGRGKSITIPLESILSIEPVSEKVIRYSIRTFGSGGMFGWLGSFSNSQLGSFKMYATELKGLIVIKTVKTTYVFSCTEREEFISNVHKILSGRDRS